jgi:ATP-dependent Clp protease ATP-binding subunit ClpB
MIKSKDIVLDATPEAIAYISKAGFDPQFGARPVKRVIQRELLNKLSKAIISGQVAADSVILVDHFEGEGLVFRNIDNLAKEV